MQKYYLSTFTFTVIHDDPILTPQMTNLRARWVGVGSTDSRSLEISRQRAAYMTHLEGGNLAALGLVGEDILLDTNGHPIPDDLIILRDAYLDPDDAEALEGFMIERIAKAPCWSVHETGSNQRYGIAVSYREIAPENEIDDPTEIAEIWANTTRLEYDPIANFLKRWGPEDGFYHA